MAGDLAGYIAWLGAYSPAGLTRWNAALEKTKACASSARGSPKGMPRLQAFISCRKKT